MKHLLTALFLFVFSAVSFGQFRMVGSGSWTTVNDSTYTATITFQADLTGQGYLATQITDTFRVFTPTEQVYRVDSVWNTTFSSASLRVVEWNGDHGLPVGQVMVYNPNGRETVPQVPFGSTGATAQMQAAVDTWNARINIQETTNSTNFGNILFVSTGGNNATAVKGDIMKPWAGPWQAVSEASPGDLVYVYPGEYTTTDSMNLWKPGVTLLFENGAKVLQKPYATALGSTLFYCHTPGEMHIYGGVFDTAAEFSNRFAIIDTQDVTIKVIGAEAVGRVSLRSGAVRTNAFIESQKLGVTYDLINNVGADSITDCNLYLHANMYRAFVSAIGVTSNSNIKRVNLNAVYDEINVWQKSAVWLNDERGFFSFSSGGTPMEDISVNVHIKKGVFSNPEAEKINLYGANSLLSHTNLTYNLDCGQCLISGGANAIIGGVVQRVRGLKGKVTGTYFFSGDAILVGATSSNFDAETDIEFDGYFYAYDKELVDSSAAAAPLTFKGKYITRNQKPLFAYTSLTGGVSLKFIDAELKNGGIAPLISLPAGAYLNGVKQYLAANDSLFNSQVSATETYLLTIDLDSLRINSLVEGVVKSTSTGALYTGPGLNGIISALPEDTVLINADGHKFLINNLYASQFEGAIPGSLNFGNLDLNLDLVSRPTDTLALFAGFGQVSTSDLSLFAGPGATSTGFNGLAYGSNEIAISLPILTWGINVPPDTYVQSHVSPVGIGGQSTSGVSSTFSGVSVGAYGDGLNLYSQNYENDSLTAAASLLVSDGQIAIDFDTEGAPDSIVFADASTGQLSRIGIGPGLEVTGGMLSAESDGNGIISALPNGNVSVNANTNSFTLANLNVLNFGGANTAEHTLVSSGSSSLPSMFRQIVGSDTTYLQLYASLGKAVLKATDTLFLDAPFIAGGPAATYTQYPSTRPSLSSLWAYNADGTGTHISIGSGELATYFTNTPPDTLSLTTSFTPYAVWQLSDVDGAVSLSPGGDSLLLDVGTYLISYDIQWVGQDAGAVDQAYVISAIRQGAGVVNKTLRTSYKRSNATGITHHVSVEYRAEITADDTPISLVLNGDDGAASGHKVLVTKALLTAEKIR